MRPPPDAGGHGRIQDNLQGSVQGAGVARASLWPWLNTTFIIIETRPVRNISLAMALVLPTCRVPLYVGHTLGRENSTDGTVSIHLIHLIHLILAAICCASFHNIFISLDRCSLSRTDTQALHWISLITYLDCQRVDHADEQGFHVWYWGAQCTTGMYFV